MASTTQDELYRKFLEVAGRQSSEEADTRALLTDVIAEFREVQDGKPASAPTQATRTSAASTESGGSGAGSVATTFLKSGFGLPALIGSLFGLFGGGGDETPPPLTKYALPESI